MVVLLKADHETGIWWGSATMLTDSFRGQKSIPERTARQALQRLEEAGYIKRFGANHSYKYPILVNKYECVDLAGKSRLLDAENTTDWRNPVYIPCRLDAACWPPTYIQQPNKKEKKLKELVFDSPELRISASQDSAFAEAFPWADRQAEYRKMRSWLVGNGKRRPNAGKFAHNWFSRMKPEERRQSQAGPGMYIPAAERNF